MRGLFIASVCLAVAVTVAHGSPVGSCSTFSGSGTINFLRDDKNCSVYYECVSTNPTKMVCPNDLHFNLVLKVCDWPAAAGCYIATPDPVRTTVFTRATATPMDAKATPTPDKAAPADVKTTVFTREPSSTEAAPLHPIEVNPEQSSTCPSVGGCPKYNGDDSLIIQLPHAYNCSRFCKCDHGSPVTFECPSGLHYNKLAGYCDYPANANCNRDRGFVYSANPSLSYASAPAEPSRRRRSWNFRRH